MSAQPQHKDPVVTAAASSASSGSTTTTTPARGLKEPKKCSIINGRKRISSIYNDNSEMIEEFDVVTDELLLRKVRKPTTVGGEGTWIVEVGSEGKTSNVDRDLIVESSSAPQLTRQDTAEEYIFRIRNLPYAADVFTVLVEQRSGNAFSSIVVRTTNKKYFKVIEIPDLNRGSIALDQSNVSWAVKYDTLTIKYKKPMSMRIVEAQEKKERAVIQSTRPKDEGCKQQ